MALISPHLPAVWQRFFRLPLAEQARLAPRREPEEAPAPSREVLEVGWLVRCLSPDVQAALAPTLLLLKCSRQLRGMLPAEVYTWPDATGVVRPRFSMSILRRKTVERLGDWLRNELCLGVLVLCTPESELSRPMRNALLVMQGRRLAQVAEALAWRLEPEALLALFQQELAALR